MTQWRRKRRKLRTESLEHRIVLDSTVVLNEIMYNPSDNGELEFVELFNQMGVDMDISSWQLADGINFTFPEGTVIPSGAYLVIAQDPDMLRAAAGVNSLGPYSGRLSNDGETIELRDRNQRLMDAVSYGDGADWPIQADGLGASLAKQNPNSISAPAEHWRSSISVGGTPGASNFGESPEPATDITRTLITSADAWRFDDSGTDLGESWRSLEFNDAAWSSAAAPYYAGSAVLEGTQSTPSPNVTAVASSELAGHTAMQAVDGSGLIGNSHVVAPAVETMWSSNGDFFGIDPDLDPEITFDLGSEKSIDLMRVWNFNNVDTETCCLDRGLALADVFIAGEDQAFELLIDNQAFDRAPGTESDFSQDIDLSGVKARYIKIDVDTTNGVANHGDPFKFVGLSEVQFLTQEPAGTSELEIGATTYYFRTEFDFDLAPERTQLVLDLLLDDAAAVYLNGSELHRQNLPEDALGYTTLASSSVADAAPSPPIFLSGDQLQSGRNVLAVEVHQAATDDADMVFGLELASITSPPAPIELDTIPLAINEVAAASAETMFVELQNYGPSAIDLSGVRLESGETSYQFPNGQSLAAGARAIVDLKAAGFSLESGHRLALYSADQSLVLDAIQIRSQAQGRAPDGTGPFLFANPATPGDANEFQLEDRIVINEIMYHYRPNAPDSGTPPNFQRLPIVALNGNWRYNDSGASLASDWHQTSHNDWQEGIGLLGFETGTPVAPGIGTPLSDDDFLTYYFETDFQLSADDLNQIDEFQLRHAIDDGAVFYLNGNEFHRFNMPAGEITAETPADGSVNNATISDLMSIPSELFVAGANRLSAEVHQRSATSNDLIFGVELAAATKIDEGRPAVPYSENDEEWIELFNRGTETVDVSGWKLDSAVGFEFPAGSQMQPGDYWVIARDASAMREKYPEIAIVGQYSGQLTNQTERIRLLDAFGNPADEVTYFEDGQWPAAADGRGSSLELQDPFADNSVGLAWAASDERSDSPWITYSYEGVTERSSIGPDGQWQEFVLGLLSDGEVLLDDIQVIEQPNGAARNLIQNGTFESDAVGAEAASWRIIGNHRHSEVIVDPDNPNNNVLRFVATGATEHMHNHAETTLKFADQIVQIRNGVDYKISFRAKWISGANLLHSRLYFNRLARTTTIVQPDQHGTPGLQNSTYVENLGPTFDNLQHSPVIPDASQPVTVSVDARDLQGIRQVMLWYSIDSGAWTSVPMAPRNETQYAGQVPGLPADSTVQFYVEGVDADNATSVFPRTGRDSRALFKVQDGKANDDGLRNFRIIVTPDDGDFLHSEVELMSNGRIGATIVYNEGEVFYDAAVRLSGSQRARPFQPRLSFSVGFNSDQLFRGVHGAITLDRSESTGFGQREHLYHHGMNHAGGLPTEYSDLFHIITPRSAHTGSAEAQLARYSDIFLDEQYQNGGKGQLYEYELTYYPTTTVGGNPESRKRPQPDSVNGISIRYISDNKEDYRWAFLNKNNRVQDDYSQFIEFTKVMSLSGDAFEAQIEDVIDVDQWLRAFAFSVITGHGDNYGSDGAQHNLQLYVRPEDNRVLQFPHDLDAFFQLNRALVGNGDLRKLMRVPEWEHMYYGHVHDMIQTTFNEQYMQRWTEYWGGLLPRQRFDRHLSDLVRRSEFLVGQIERQAGRVDFSISTEDFNTESSEASISGAGWVDVRELRLQGSLVPLETNWSDVTQWDASIPLTDGVNQIVVEAYGFQGELIGSDTVQITSTTPNPVVDSLKLVELNYHPADATASELAVDPSLESDDFEFVEVVNLGTVPINPLGVHFGSGIEFTFPTTTLAPAERAVIVRDISAFRLRYGDEPRVIGEFASGQLANGGEQLTMLDANGTLIADLDYGDGDPWPERADGAGASLVLIDPATPSEQLGKYDRWRGSYVFGGTPGQASAASPGIVINEVLTNSEPPASDAIELMNVSLAAVDLSGWWLSDSDGDFQKFAIPDGTILGPGERVVFDESNFNPNPANPGENDFALSSAGDDVWLVITAAQGNVVSFVDDVHFVAANTGESFGRHPDGQGRLHPMRETTLGQTNADPRVGPIIISELSYNPGIPSDAALMIDPNLEANDLEFIEVWNNSGQQQSLADWRIRGGVDIDFDSALTMAAGEAVVVVSFNPADPGNQARLNAFRVHYGISPDVQIVGGLSGQLANEIEKVQLRRPDRSGGDLQHTLEDEVIYDNAAPWPANANGTGNSLTRSDATGSGNVASHWVAARPTPGSAGATGDLNQDGVANVDDIDLLCSSIRNGDNQFDLNNDQATDLGDLDFLVENVFFTSAGDANLDRGFNSRDLVLIFQAGEYEDNVVANSTWAEGDWNCDAEFDTRDLVVAFQKGNYEAAAAPAANANNIDQVAAAIDETFQASRILDDATHVDNSIPIASESRRMVDLELAATDRLFERVDEIETKSDIALDAWLDEF